MAIIGFLDVRPWLERRKCAKVKNHMTWLLKAIDEKGSSVLPGELAGQEDSRLLIIAGRYAIVALFHHL